MSRREGEFARLQRLREERLAEEREIRRQERDIRRKKEHFKRQEEQRLLKLQEEEEARKREGGYLMLYTRSLSVNFYQRFNSFDYYQSIDCLATIDLRS